MPEIIACPQCKGKLKLPEALLGKKVRCPDCKNTFVAGASAPVAAPPPLPQFKQGVAAPPIRRPVPPPAEVVEIDADDLIVEEEAPRSRGSSGNHRRREEVTDAPRPRKRRDDYDDEDDDRPRSRRRRDDYDEDDRPRRRKRQREDDYSDDEEDLDPEEARRRARAERAAWRTADIGVILHGIGNWLCVGSASLVLLSMFILLIMLATKSGSLGMFRFLGVLYVIAFVLWCINIILADVGYGFWIAAPSRYGAKGLAIGCMVVGALIPIFLLVIVFTGASAIDSGLQGRVGGFGSTLAGMGVMAILTLVLEVARLTLFPLFLWAGGRAMRAREFTDSALRLAIVTPSTIIGTVLLSWLINAVMPLNEAAVWIGMFTSMMVAGTVLAMFLWGAITLSNARSVLP
jgi:hypothetical protein